MPQRQNRIKPLVGLLSVVILVAVAFFYRQMIIDTVRYITYKPSDDIASIAGQTTMTDEGKFYFYASRPEVSGRSTFNTECQRMEADSPVLGCYTYQQIFIFDITDEKLDGIEQVTAAHELLHAVYERMSESEKESIAAILTKDYERLKDKELIERMKYYSKNEPGEEENELFSILGTEFKDIDTRLESIYSKYFEDRLAVVALHDKSQAVFNSLNNRAQAIASQLNKLVDKINENTEYYNVSSAALEVKITKFNSRAAASGGFQTQAEFDTERANLLAEVEALKAKRAMINKDLATYEKLRAELEAVAAESSALNKSIDSSLVPATEL